MRAHTARGSRVEDDSVQALARQWSAMLLAMCGGDRGVVATLHADMDERGADAATRGIISADVWEYVKRAFAVGSGSH